MNLPNFDRVIGKLFLWGLPLVVTVAIALNFVDKSSNAVADSFNSFAGLLFSTWMVAALYLSIRIVFSNATRTEILSRITFLREKDEREILLTGHATRSSYLTTLAILILMLFLSMFQISVREDTLSSNPDGAKRSLSLGISLDLTDGVEKQTDKSDNGTVQILEYSQLPISKFAIILFLIIWQITSYNVMMRKFLNTGTTEPE